MGSRADGKDLDRRSSPKTFHRKLQIEKTTIETNYALKPVFSEFFFDHIIFSM
jgi:hypothetical protein